MEIIRSGRSFLLRGSRDAKPHLWFVLTDPERDSARVIAVMLRTATSFTDKTVILEAGDHPFVKHASSIHYSTARFFELNGILRAMESGSCRLHEDMSRELLERTRRGLLQSPFTVNAIKDYCRNRF